MASGGRHEHDIQTSECMSSNGCVVCLALTWMSFCMCCTSMHAVHIESTFVKPSIIDCRGAG